MSCAFYLEQLIIQNFATFKYQKIAFKAGVNALIGETGSGKSLVLEAIGVVLGGKANKKSVRKDEEYALIEAQFYCKDQKILDFLAEEGFPVEENQLILKRMIHSNGTTRSFINQFTTTTIFLQRFSKNFIDIVGQFENQRLLSENYQIYLLDQFLKNQSEVLEFRKIFNQHKEIQLQIQQFGENQSRRNERISYLQFQIEDIENLNPSEEDENSLNERKNVLINQEKLTQIGIQLSDIFNGAENTQGLWDYLKKISTLTLKNQQFFNEELPLIESIKDKLVELEKMLMNKTHIELEPFELEKILNRLDHYQRVKRKFSAPISSILTTLQDYKKELSELVRNEENLEHLTELSNKTFQLLVSKANILHEKRIKGSLALSEALTERVQDLKMQGAEIIVKTNKDETLNENGFTQVQFIAQTNPGEGFFKIKEIASGGELSRILLAIRQIIASHDEISIYLLDEIDTGLGGETAIRIGQALKKVSLKGQVIAITHLPQIAQFADNLIVVSKDTQLNNINSRTESMVRQLEGKLIMKEIKSMQQLH